MEKLKAVFFAMVAVALIFSLAQAQDAQLNMQSEDGQIAEVAKPAPITITPKEYWQLKLDQARTKKALIRLQFEEWNKLEQNALAELRKLQAQPVPERGD